MVAMAGYFVPLPGDLTDQIRIMFGNPAEYKKGSLHFSIFEESQQAFSVSFNPGFPPRPVFQGNNFIEGFDMVVVFQIYSERIYEIRIDLHCHLTQVNLINRVSAQWGSNLIGSYERTTACHCRDSMGIVVEESEEDLLQ